MSRGAKDNKSQDTNGHGCEDEGVVSVPHIGDRKILFATSSVSNSGSLHKTSSSAVVSWDLQTGRIRPHSAEPIKSGERSSKPKKCDRQLKEEDIGWSTENPQMKRSTALNSPTSLSFPSDGTEGSFVSGMSSVSMGQNSLSSPSQPATRSDRCNHVPKKFDPYILESTLRLMKYRLHYPSLLSKFRHLVNTKTIYDDCKEVGPLGGEILRRRVERQSVSSVPRPSSMESGVWLIKHQWKCRYYALLDAVDLLYKDYQLLHHATRHQNQRRLSLSFPERLLSSYSNGLTVGHDRDAEAGVLAGADPVAHLANRFAEHTASSKSHLWPHRFHASVCFILDVIAQCRLLRVELDKMNEFRDRVFRLTTEVRKQRDRLKRHMVEQRKNISEISHSLKEVLERIAHSQGQSPFKIRPKKSPQGAERDVLETQKKLTHQQSQIPILETVLREEEAKRRHMHNRLQEITGNIRVLCRVRPNSPSRKLPHDYLKVTSDDKLLLCPKNIPEILLGTNSTTLKSLKSTSNPEGFKCFIFDKVFGPDAEQQAVYKEVDDCVISCIDGFNVCVMAYGQTGSGKTHTMVGTVHNPGVNRRAIQRLLQLCQTRRQWNYRLSMSMLEVYQEEVFDLLIGSAVDSISDGDHAHNADFPDRIRQFSPTGFMTSSTGSSFAHLRPSRQRRLSMVRLRSTREDELILQNLTEKIIETEEDMVKLLELGEKRRSTGITQLNMNSSRSHMLLLLRVTGEHKVNRTQTRGTLILADLAGSEKIGKSGSVGRRFHEATCINKSLSCLARVFDSLRKHLKPVYRETKLTYLLKPTLGGDGKCLVLVNIRSEPENLEETLRAVNFGQGALQVTPWKSITLGASSLVSGASWPPKPRPSSRPAFDTKACVRDHDESHLL